MPSTRFWVLAAVTVAFSLLSAKAIAEFGYVGLWQLPFQTSGTLQLFCDLGIAMFLVATWMVKDARARKVAVAPWLVLTVLAGSTGPLGYLLVQQ